MGGMQALLHLLLWGDASLQLRFESPAGERKIHLPVDGLLSQAATFVQEFEKLAARVGGARAIYRQAPTRAAEVRNQIPVEVMNLVKLFDGERPIVDIVEDSPFKPFDTIKIIFRLSDLGAIARVDTAGVESPLTAQLAVRDWLLGTPASEEPGSTMTGAGRHAAEGLAAAGAKEAAVVAPPKAATVAPLKTVIVAPQKAPIVAPQAPLEAHAAQYAREAALAGAPTSRSQGHQVKKKAKNKRDKHTALDAAPAVGVGAADAAISYNPLPVSPARPEAAAVSVAAKPALSPAPGPAPAPDARPVKRSEPIPAKLSPQAAASAHAKEPIFSDMEEDFFAREADLHKVHPVETFDDLESGPQRKLSSRRRWFLFGAREGAAPPPKKR
jgi:hypothetical protein